MPIDRRTFLHGATAATLSAGLAACGPRGPVGTPGGAGGGVPLDLSIGPGGWCWFQSPRAAIDETGSLWLGSSRGTAAPEPGRVEVTQVDLARRSVVGRWALGRDRVDDHTSPSVLAIDGEVQVGWAPHRREAWLEVGRLGGERPRIVRPDAVVEPGRGTAYVSAHVVAGVRWVLYRGEGFTWNLLTSPDGRRWSARGAVVRPDAPGQRPYVAAASDGERLHLVASDGNPTERPGTGVGYGVIEPGGAIFDGSGRALGRVGDPPTAASLTRLLEGRAGPAEDTDTDAWIAQLAVIHRRPTALLTLREPWPAGEIASGRWRHRLFWARQRHDGRWTVEPLAWAGRELYRNQPDYCGLGCLDPLDPTRAVIATDVDPVSGEPLHSPIDGRSHHELFEGHRRAEGSWRWTQLTRPGTRDNLRPVLVAGSGTSALAWMRGTYRSWSDFDTEIVVRFA